MKSFEIGAGLTCDLERLVTTRLLVQANSGGGKSWLLRRILEQTAGKIQQLVIDPEGEFSTLREQFDYVLAAKSGGDTAADPRTAKLLAERLLELKVSAILDIYELDQHQRVLFVRRFLEALIDAPKTLWHPVLVVVDEAHVYCPEVGQAESANAVKALATRGRKRGFCAVFATQRLSKFAKDAAAECNNKLIGRTSLDVDMVRAGDELGFTKDARTRLRELPAGHFFAYGPAFDGAQQAIGILPVTVGPVKTTHPEAGGRLALAAPPPTSKVKALLPKLSDLPAEAADRERSIAELKTELANTKRELTLARKEQPAPKAETKTVEKPVLKDGQIARAEKIVERLKATADQHLEAAQKHLDVQKELDEIAHTLAQAILSTTSNTQATTAQRVVHHRQAPVMSTHGRRVAPVAATNRPAPVVSTDGILKAEQRILDALAWWKAAKNDGPTRHQVAFVARYTVNGHFNNMVGSLRAKGLVDYPQGGGVSLTDAGEQAANPPDVVPTRDGLIEAVATVLKSESPRRIFKAVVDAGRDLTREELAELTNYTVNGHFNNMVGSLRSLGVIDYPRQGGVKLSEMFEALE